MSEQQTARYVAIEVDEPSRLREQVAAEVRALMARRRITGGRISRAIGKSDMYVSRRLRGETSFDLDDLEEIAALLGVPVSALFPASASEVRSIRTSAYGLSRAEHGPGGTKRPPNMPANRRSNLIRRPMSAKPYAA